MTGQRMKGGTELKWSVKEKEGYRVDNAGEHT